MSATIILSTIMLTAPPISPEPPVDLSKIEKRIAVSPAFTTNNPTYALFVFGPQAKTRIWAVLDGRTLWLDRNGNGNLTDPDEKIAPDQGPKWPLDLFDSDGKVIASLRSFSIPPSTYTRIIMEVSGIGRQYVGFDPGNRFTMGKTIQDAPIIHFGGPMSYQWYESNPELVIGQTTPLDVCVGSPGIGKGTFAAIGCGVLNGRSPIAHCTFPRGNQSTVTVRASIADD